MLSDDPQKDPIIEPIYGKVPFTSTHIVQKPYTLSEIENFYNDEGKFLLEDPKKITISQGDGQSTTVTLYANDTMYDVAEKINKAISKNLGQGKFTDDVKGFCTIASGAANTSESVRSSEEVDTLMKPSVYDYVAPEPPVVGTPTTPGIPTNSVDDENSDSDTDANDTWFVGAPEVSATMLVRSAVAGKAGELTFSGDEELLSALGFNTIHESSESVFKALVTDAHTNESITEAKITGNNLKGVIAKNVDVEFSNMAGIKSHWDETSKSYKLQAREYSND